MPKESTEIVVAGSDPVHVLAAKIGRIHQAHHLHYAMTIGELLCREISQGTGQETYRSLSKILREQENIILGATTLFNYRKVFEVMERRKELTQEQNKQLTLEHYKAVLALPSNKQDEWLKEAREKKLSARKLKNLCKKPKKKKGRPKGRKKENTQKQKLTHEEKLRKTYELWGIEEGDLETLLTILSDNGSQIELGPKTEKPEQTPEKNAESETPKKALSEPTLEPWSMAQIKSSQVVIKDVEEPEEEPEYEEVREEPLSLWLQEEEYESQKEDFYEDEYDWDNDLELLN
jgi:hypothetical protein